MSEEPDYSNNPLHSLKLKDLLNQLVDHYGWEILAAYLNINCFKTNPSIDSSLKFLRKTEWAKEKVEAFYMYQYKSLPKADDEQYELSPRDRIVPPNQEPGEPRELSLEDAARLREKRANSTHRRSGPSNRSGGSDRSRGHSENRSKPSGRTSSKDNSASSSKKPADSSNPWANFVPPEKR